MKTERIVEALEAAAVATLVSAYGNEFFVAGQAGVDYDKRTGRHVRFQRNTLLAIARMGLLKVRPGVTGRGEFNLTDAGRRFLEQQRCEQ